MIPRFAIFIFTLLLACSLPIKAAPATQAAPASQDARPPIQSMTLPQLLAEFHDPASMSISMPQPQRWTDLLNALRHQSDALLPQLKTDLAKPDAQARLRALRVLAYLGNRARPALPELLATMADPDESTRSTTVSILGSLKDPRAFLSLTAALHDPSPKVRAAIATNAGPSFADGSFATLALALSDKDRTVRQTALQQLKLFGDKRAAPYIIPSLNDTEVIHYEKRDDITLAWRNCDAAVEALEQIINANYIVTRKGSQQDQDRSVEQWRNWWKANSEKFTQDLDAEPDLVRPTR
jgi:HEAT repeat protein